MGTVRDSHRKGGSQAGEGIPYGSWAVMAPPEATPKPWFETNMLQTAIAPLLEYRRNAPEH